MTNLLQAAGFYLAAIIKQSIINTMTTQKFNSQNFSMTSLDQDAMEEMLVNGYSFQEVSDHMAEQHIECQWPQYKAGNEVLAKAYRDDFMITASWLRQMCDDVKEICYVEDVDNQERKDIRLYSFDNVFFLVKCWVDTDEFGTKNFMNEIIGSGATKAEAIKEAATYHDLVI